MHFVTFIWKCIFLKTQYCIGHGGGSGVAWVCLLLECHCVPHHDGKMLRPRATLRCNTSQCNDVIQCYARLCNVMYCDTIWCNMWFECNLVPMCYKTMQYSDSMQCNVGAAQSGHEVTCGHSTTPGRHTPPPSPPQNRNRNRNTHANTNTNAHANTSTWLSAFLAQRCPTWTRDKRPSVTDIRCEVRETIFPHKLLSLGGPSLGLKLLHKHESSQNLALPCQILNRGQLGRWARTNRRVKLGQREIFWRIFSPLKSAQMPSSLAHKDCSGLKGDIYF